MNAVIQCALFFGTVGLTIAVGCGLWDRIRPLDEEES